MKCADEWYEPNIKRYYGTNRPPGILFKSCDHVVISFRKEYAVIDERLYGYNYGPIDDEEKVYGFQLIYGFQPGIKINIQTPSDLLLLFQVITIVVLGCFGNEIRWFQIATPDQISKFFIQPLKQKSQVKTCTMKPFNHSPVNFVR